jgi:hypothetical protein
MNLAGVTELDGYPVETLAGFDSGTNHRYRTLAIVGSHPEGLEGVPWDDPSVEVWLFNEAPLKPEKYPRWDAVLQIHTPLVYANENNWVNPNYWTWLQQPHGKTIWMQEVDPRVPDSKRYPLESVLSMTPYSYLRSSPAMALALAIYLGYGKIHLFGSRLESNTEYGYQATNYAFWIGFAHGRGVDLQLHCWLGEFNQRIYGYEGELQIDPAFYINRQAEFSKAFEVNSRAMRDCQNKLDQAMLENNFDNVGGLSIDLENIAQVAGEAYGMMSEAKRYSERTDMISRQEFERTAAKALQDGDQARSDKDKEGGKCEYVWNAWKLTGRNDALNQLRVFLKQKTQLAYTTGEKSGVYNENINYLNEYDARLTAAGGVRALGKQA